MISCFIVLKCPDNKKKKPKAKILINLIKQIKTSQKWMTNKINI